MIDHCDEKGNMLDTNLSDEQTKAIKDLNTKIKNEDLVCLETDKTGKFALDTKKNYITKVQKHIEKDAIISIKEVGRIERKLNEHADHATKMVMAGENTDQKGRIKSNFKTKDNQIPVLHGTSKDHKEVLDPEEGPEVRPIMGAVVGPNVALSDFIGREIVRRVIDSANSDTICKSTEELLSRFEAYNKGRMENKMDKANLILASMDIKKWYPNTLTRPSAKIIKKMLLESGLKFIGIDYDAVARYIGEVLTKEEILDEKFEEIVYTKNKNAVKKKSRKQKDRLKNGTEELDEDETEELYLKPTREPTEIEKRNLLGKSVEILIITSLLEKSLSAI